MFVLRAVRLSTDDTFVHSHKAEKLDYFISHSWRDNGNQKWLSLLLRINLKIALIAANIAAALTLLFIKLYPALYPFAGWKIHRIEHNVVGGPAPFVFYVVPPVF